MGTELSRIMHLRLSVVDLCTINLILLSLVCSYSDYAVYSNFTLAFFEDSGWYQVNRSYIEAFDQFELQWGRGS